MFPKSKKVYCPSYLKGICLLSLVVCSRLCNAQEFEWNPEKLSEQKEFVCELMREDKNVKIGPAFKVSVKFRKTDAAGQIYNPFFNMNNPFLPIFALYDADHQYLGNWLDPHPTSPFESRRERSPTPSDWVSMRSGHTIGVDNLAVLSVVPRAYGKPKPGKHYLQLIFSSKTVSTCKSAFQLAQNNPDVEHAWYKWLADWKKQETERDYFRSNVLELEFFEAP